MLKEEPGHKRSGWIRNVVTYAVPVVLIYLPLWLYWEHYGYPSADVPSLVMTVINTALFIAIIVKHRKQTATSL